MVDAPELPEVDDDIDMEDYLAKDNEVMEEKQVEYTPPENQTEDVQEYHENDFIESTI